MANENLSTLLNNPSRQLEILDGATIEDLRNSLRNELRYSTRLYNFNEDIGGLNRQTRTLRSFLLESDFNPYDFTRSVDEVSRNLEQIADLIENYGFEGNIRQELEDFNDSGGIQAEMLLEIITAEEDFNEETRDWIQEIFFGIEELSDNIDFEEFYNDLNGQVTDYFQSVSENMMSLKRGYYQSFWESDRYFPDGGWNQLKSVLLALSAVAIASLLIVSVTSFELAAAIAVALGIIGVLDRRTDVFDIVPRSINISEFGNRWRPGLGNSAVSGQIVRQAINFPDHHRVCLVSGQPYKKFFLEENNAWGFVTPKKSIDFLAVYLANPIANIGYFGKVKNVENSGNVELARSQHEYPDYDPKKNVIQLVPGSLMRLLDPIPRGKSPIRGVQYVELAEFKQATDTDDL